MNPPLLSRRRFLGSLALATAATGLRTADAAKVPPIRQITRGPKFHWFGYYDKLQFSPDNRFVLCNQVNFENRSPRPDDVIKVGLIDLRDGDKWTELGESRAWCWQQGCMLQWLPGSASEVIWNDREGDRFVAHILDVQTRRKRTLPHPIYAVGPDGTWAVAPSFSRLADLRPGYGYVGVPDPFRDELAPEGTGIFRLDLKTGAQSLLFSVAGIAAKFSFQSSAPDKAKHWFNHLLVNLDGTRMVFLHRWRIGDGSFNTHMISAAPDGADARVLVGSGFVSHFYWRGPRHMLAYSKPRSQDAWGFFVYEDKAGGSVDEIGKGVLKGDGHCTYLPLPGHRWVLNDTYRDGKKIQHPHLFDTQTGRRTDLGEMLLPDKYLNPPHNEWRVDLHPRFSRDGKLVTIDSPYTGQGRQLHLIDIAELI